MPEEKAVEFSGEFIEVTVKSVRQTIGASHYRQDDSVMIYQQRFQKEDFSLEAVIVAANNLPTQDAG